MFPNFGPFGPGTHPTHRGQPHPNADGTINPALTAPAPVYLTAFTQVRAQGWNHLLSSQDHMLYQRSFQTLTQPKVVDPARDIPTLTARGTDARTQEVDFYKRKLQSYVDQYNSLHANYWADDVCDRQALEAGARQLFVNNFVEPFKRNGRHCPCSQFVGQMVNEIVNNRVLNIDSSTFPVVEVWNKDTAVAYTRVRIQLDSSAGDHIWVALFVDVGDAILIREMTIARIQETNTSV